MDEYGESYGLEEQYEPDPGEPEADPEETGADPEEAFQEDETGRDEDLTEGQPENDGQETAAEIGDGAEDEGTDEETVSGNDLIISGDAVIFPEDYDFSAFTAEPADMEPVVQAIEKQNDNMTAGFICTSFLLGLLAGAMVIAGFRLRRV